MENILVLFGFFKKKYVACCEKGKLEGSKSGNQRPSFWVCHNDDSLNYSTGGRAVVEKEYLRYV